MIVVLLAALVPTILIELGVLWLLLERRRRVLLASVAVNVLTNVPLNLYLMLANDDIGLGHILVGEVVVFVLEALWYLAFTRNLRQACIYSALCNAVSFLVGILAEILVEGVVLVR